MQGFSILKHDLKLVFFLLALSLYALWGSPTPDRPGVIELSVAVLLIFSISVSNLFKSQNLSLNEKTEKWRIAVWILWGYGLSVPVIVALSGEATITIMARDIIGFIFLCLPLFLYEFFDHKKNRQKFFLVLCLLIGVTFSIRVLLPNFILFDKTSELLYLANSPLVLFTSLFLASYACRKIFYKLDLHHLLFFGVCIIGSVVTLMAMFVDVQRASFAALALTIISLFIIGFIKAPLRTIIPLILMTILGVIFYDFLSVVSQDIAIKTSRVGLNMRFQEWQAVWERLSESWIYVLFGHGWGSSFASPAVGGLHVTYTHSLLSYMFFKTGLIGLILTLTYLVFIFEKLVRLYFSDPVKGNALLWPLLIPVFLYASHKSFDFGLLLVLILVMKRKEESYEI